jgi:N-acetyl-anhydromuramyl-L-alanine amidase AmpD
MNNITFAELMATAEINTVTQANMTSAQRVSEEVRAMVQGYGYGYADGSVEHTSARVVRALYNLLEQRQTDKPVDTCDVIHAIGEFVKMIDAAKVS